MLLLERAHLLDQRADVVAQTAEGREQFVQLLAVAVERLVQSGEAGLQGARQTPHDLVDDEAAKQRLVVFHLAPEEEPRGQHQQR